ncbi:MAG: F0F1 ATP synthase subunit epsilon [Actinomycetota bacterium]|nr:F0F1 ATP synthase subunit epsilon [Actinomycetota bacterium]
MADEHRFEAEVLTPEGEVYRGELWQLSTRTSVGEVGIRARHAPIVARLVPNQLRLYESEGAEPDARYAQGEGWLEVFANRARVLIAEAVEPDKLDAADLKAKLEDAEQRIEEAEEGSAAEEQAVRDKARAEAFLEIAEGS